MAQDSAFLFRQMQPLIHQEILRVSQKRDDNSQYRGSSIQKHSHNNLDSPPINYTSLSNVRNYLVSTSVALNSGAVGFLHSAPITLIQAPGVRAVIIVHSITARITYSGIAFTGANNLEFRYTNGAGTKVTTDIPSTFINSTANAFAHAPAITTEFTPVENAPVVVSVPVADPAAGNSAMYLVAHYHVVSFGT